MNPEKYRLKEHFQVIRESHKAVAFRSEFECFFLRTPLATAMATEIARQAVSLNELIDQLAGQFPLELGSVFPILKDWEDAGIITKSPEDRLELTARFLQASTPQKSSPLPRLKVYKIQIVTVGDVNSRYLEKAFLELGLQISDQPGLTIVLADDYASPALENINQEFIKTQSPWLLLRLQGSKPRIGPYFDPSNSESSCWCCLAHRLRLNDEVSRAYQTMTGQYRKLASVHSKSNLVEEMASGYVALQLVSWLKGKSPFFLNQVIELSPVDFSKKRHRVVKRPQCKTCGDPGLFKVPMKPIQLVREDELLVTIGGYRLKSPIATFQHFQHHVSSITGTVPFLKQRGNSKETPVFNFSAGKNKAIIPSSRFWLNVFERSTNGGKGKSQEQARTGALCEALERYSMVYNDISYGFQSYLNDLSGAIHPNRVMNYSDQQFKDRLAINAKCAKSYSVVPLPMPAQTQLEWTPVFSLTHQDFKFLPTCLCYAQYPAVDDTKRYAYPDSNGCAAGNSIEEAILQGLLELIERDATAIWWYNMLKRPGIDLNSAANPYLNEVQKYYQEIGRSLHLLDLTSDLGVPVVAAVSQNIAPNGPPELLFAFGAHVEVQIAVERAVTELNQLLPNVNNVFEENSTTKDLNITTWLANASLAKLEYLMPTSSPFKHIHKDYPELCSRSIIDGIQFCIKALEKAGLEPLVLDLTQPDLEIPVVKVFVPGLRHMWRRTAPGRLYDVPVKMGWLSEPLSEMDLNPNSIFI